MYREGRGRTFYTGLLNTSHHFKTYLNISFLCLWLKSIKCLKIVYIKDIIPRGTIFFVYDKVYLRRKRPKNYSIVY